MSTYDKSGLQINGQDVSFVTKEYLLDSYPSLIDNMKTAGLWMWGYNTNGELGTNDITNRSSPVQTVAGGTNWKQVSCGYFNTEVVKMDGTLWLWGDNFYGQIGDNNNGTSRSSPVQTVSGGTNWKEVAGGQFHTAAIKTDGSLWLWGRNASGQLGTNNTTDRSSPVQTISTGTNWKQAAGGQSHTSAIKTDGSLWSWGLNTSGQLGDNSAVSKSSPVQTISTGTNWKLVACGFYFTSAIKTDGTLWTWGNNGHGQLGTNNITHRSSPVQTVAGGTDWKFVATGLFNVAAIKTDGTLWIWGYNNLGILGTNDTTHRSSPVQTVAGGTNWKLVASGVYHTAAIKSDGTLWTWGRNIEGQLGTNNITSYSSPVQTVFGGTNWKLVSCGNYHTSTIRDDSSDPFRGDYL